MSPALQALAMYRQFILYKLVPSIKNPGKTDKKPVNLSTMDVHNPHDPAIWFDYETAKAYASTLGKDYGVGFVFTANDPFFFLDIDNCIDTATGVMSDVASNLIAALPGAAVETSQSGKGLHIIGMTGPIEHSCKNAQWNCELYTQERFVALTDNNTYGNAATDCTQNIPWVVTNYFPPKAATVAEAWRDTPVPEWSGPESDDELLGKMLKSKSGAAAFGNKASFADLWNNNEAVLGVSYPSLNAADPYDRSSADKALVHHLAFWTGKNHERMKRMMWQSKLVRDKWTWHKNYLSDTILKAVSEQVDVYSSKGRRDQVPAPTGQMAQPEGAGQQTAGVQLLVPSAQQDHFKGCVYVRHLHKIFVPDGSLLKPDQFKASYGRYTFSMDSLNEKVTKNAWECFTESQAIHFPWVHNICFRPELEPGAIVEEEGMKMVNTYIPVNTASAPGDVTPFLNHVKTLLPNEEDQQILLAYMAACVQYIGVKFQWCPLIQGTEGNGKSLIGHVLAHCVGQRYTHFPNASDLAGNGFKFNAWLCGKLLIVLEEIYTSNRREITEPLKVIVSNQKIEIQGKGVDQYTGDNRANLLILTNHKDALPVTIDTRRYCIMYCAQQSYADMEKDGLVGEYFPKLYGWLKNEGGLSFVNHYLSTYQIPDHLNPATACQRAPKTESLNEAIELSIGSIESEIMEAIDEGRPGFIYPWISSLALDKLLNKINAARMIPNNKRKALVHQLGYVPHPALPKGRMNQTVSFEGGKPRVYVKRNSLEHNLVSGADVYHHYTEAQGYSELTIQAGDVVPMHK